MTKKLFLAVLSVVAVFAALGTTTYAWFALNLQASTDVIEINLTAGDGVELSVDNINWYPVLSQAQIEADLSGSTMSAYWNYDTPASSAGVDCFSWDVYRLTAVSPVGTLATFHKFRIDEAIAAVTPEGVFDAAVATSEYVQIPLLVRARGADKVIKWVQPTATPIIGGNVVTWAPTAAFTAAVNGTADSSVAISATPMSAQAANAMRISLENYVIEKSTTTGTGLTNTVSGNFASLSLKGAHEFFNARIGAYITTAIIDDAIDKFDDLESAGVSFNLDSTITTTGISLGAGGLAITSANTATHTVYSTMLRVWIEGWDYECLDAVLSQTATTGLSNVSVRLFFSL